LLLLDDRIPGLRPDRRRTDAQKHIRRLIAPLAQSFEV
jgi:hypothetical protein